MIHYYCYYLLLKSQEKNVVFFENFLKERGGNSVKRGSTIIKKDLFMDLFIRSF